LCQNAFGEIPQFGLCATHLFEADLKSNGLPDGFAHLFRNVTRCHTCRETAGFEYIHVGISCAQKRRWHARSFTRAWFGL